jgi:hypothetical protein
LNEQERNLLAYFRKLAQQDAHALLRYAAFLAGEQHSAATKNISDTPVAIPQPLKTLRPEKERVVDALKRLSAAYPMLDSKQLFDKASTLVAQHVMFGKPANVVIDDIEKLFAEEYARFVSAKEGK